MWGSQRGRCCEVRALWGGGGKLASGLGPESGLGYGSGLELGLGPEPEVWGMELGFGLWLWLGLAEFAAK